MTKEELLKMGLTEADIAAYEARMLNDVMLGNVKKLSARQWELINSFIPEFDLLTILSKSQAEIKELCYSAIHGQRI